MSDASEARPRILVADDSKVMRLSASKILDAEFDLIVEVDGLAAWDRLHKDPEILALFTDVGMPGMDGFELLGRIRDSGEERIRELPVIIVTGNDEDEARDKALDLGATDFITKPFDRAQLLARARAHATHDRMRRRTSELEEANIQDTVTGLGNSRYFEQRLRESRAWGLRHDLPMAVMRLDILDFESLVRERGKRVAVDVLREVGQQLAATLREEDVIARLGSARFAAVCPECDAEGVRALAERISETLGERRFAGEHGIRLQVAVGAYLPGSDESESIEAIYKAAQAAVQAAARQGSGGIVLRPQAGSPGDDPAAQLEEALFSRLKKMLERLPAASASRVISRLQEVFGGGGERQRGSG
ncbi:diguanylate cyclase domain-containing protein [Natronospira bacteriovora]|uniref:Diguanylate cyclase n=1 Tax=Natronospira bacteriovora TaxID=3069753 RepID=A0ABU0WA60_9GAMM|nr:diguanylate cyclase [Natronospira sp. AB-CW4]MDQ2070847.1 diguanylate cyclase [Natronospira sp. AB-CW4]